MIPFLSLSLINILQGPIESQLHSSAAPVAGEAAGAAGKSAESRTPQSSLAWGRRTPELAAAPSRPRAWDGERGSVQLPRRTKWPK